VVAYISRRLVDAETRNRRIKCNTGVVFLHLTQAWRKTMGHVLSTKMAGAVELGSRRD
jgi:hypothetical protein